MSKPKSPPPSWSSIPNKVQLALICSIRIVDFFQQASMQAYIFYQLASFSPDAPESEISFQSGVLQGVFTAAQIITSPLFGKLADSPVCGRKGVILISLVGQSLSCIGVAFSRSFRTAVIWRLLGGAINATVGGARTALSECTEKKYHSRTFLLLPLAWNLANIFAPVIGGLLSDPVRYYPGLFGENSAFGGQYGVAWLREFPYAVPNLFSAFILLGDAMLLFLFLRETLASIRHSRDRGVELAETLRFFFRKVFSRSDYVPIGQSDNTNDNNNEDTYIDRMNDGTSSIQPPSIAMSDLGTEEQRLSSPEQRTHELREKSKPLNKTAVFLVLATFALLDLQLSGFTGLWTTFLSTAARSLSSDPAPILPFKFTGGIGFSPSTIGLAMSILGAVGIFCQLTLYPTVNARFGLLRSTAFSLFLFPVAYIVAPYLSLLAPYSYDSLPLQTALWACILMVALMVISARTFAIPGIVLLTNNTASGPETLGMIHGLGAATSSAFRTLGPIVAGRWYQIGLEKGRVGEAWWWLAFWALVGCIPIWWVKDG